jgi:murein tripeptide amidase MpaA
MLDLLTQDNESSKLLLQNFVFKIVPVLNPDGVARGYWRTDCNNTNLNRVYSNPDPLLFPTIFSVRKLIEVESQNSKLFAYVDLHGHASKRGCFVFGNSIQDQDKFIE